MDIHSYTYYKGDLSNVDDKLSHDGIVKCTFKGQEMYCYYHESKTGLFEGKFYMSKCRYGRLIIPINEKITDQIDIENQENMIDRHTLDLTRKGKYGCIPKFIKNEKGNIAYVTEEDTKVITLHIARHDMINELNDTILELEPHFFPISDSDYDKLNGWFKDDNFIQGGVDERSLSKLNVFTSLNANLGTIYMKPNP